MVRDQAFKLIPHYFKYICERFLLFFILKAPILFAKAAEIFISELSLRAWIHTEDNKRRTLQVRIFKK